MATGLSRTRKIQIIVGLSIVALVGILLVYGQSTPNCGCANPDPSFLGSAGLAPSNLGGATRPSGASLVNALDAGTFPSIHLSIPHSAPGTSVLYGPELSDAQLRAGVRAEVEVDLPSTDAHNTVDYDVFDAAGPAEAWFKTFTLGMHKGYQIQKTYAPSGIPSAKCEQFRDGRAGRATGGTQCFALVGSVVVYGESIIYDTAAGSPADAEAMLKAGIAYLHSVGGA